MTDLITRRRRVAKNGTLIIGGGFAGAHVARLLGPAGATIVSPESSMLYTPLLPEVAAGAIEPRHVYVPLNQMCPHAEILRGSATALDERWRTLTVSTEIGPIEVEYDRLVIALGSTARMLPIPGLAERALAFKNLGDAVHLRNHILRRLDLADLDPANAERYLTFVFVGAGYAGVEALAETMQLVHDALRRRCAPACEPRWVLVNAGPSILGEVPHRLGRYAATQLQRRGVELLNGTTLDRVEPEAVILSDGRRIETDTLVWTAGVVPHPLVRELGLPLDDRGRIAVDSTMRVEGRCDIWALGDCAGVPNEATPGRTDPPTCQHALRQARALARTLRGRLPRPYRYRSMGEGATLGRDRGILRFRGLLLRGRLAALLTRIYHVQAVPLGSRRVRIVADGILSTLFRRDVVELGTIEPRQRPSETAPARAAS